MIGRYPLKFWIEEGLVNRCSRTRIPRLGGCCVEAAPLLQSKEAQEPGQEFEEEKQGIHRCVSQQTLLATPHSSADGYILLCLTNCKVFFTSYSSVILQGMIYNKIILCCVGSTTRRIKKCCSAFSLWVSFMLLCSIEEVEEGCSPGSIVV